MLLGWMRDAEEEAALGRRRAPMEGARRSELVASKTVATLDGVL